MNWRTAIDEEGFATLPQIFSANHLDGILDEIKQAAPRRSRAGLRNAMRLPPVAALGQQPGMMEIAREVLGTDAFPFRATLFDKSPTSNWLIVWHQDTALPIRERINLAGWGPWSVKKGIIHAHAPATALEQVLALRVSFDDSTSQNGPLRALPRTHTLGILSDDKIVELSTQITAVECIVPKGGVLAMRPLLVHASSKSQAEMPRRVLHIEYAASSSIASPLQLAIA